MDSFTRDSGSSHGKSVGDKSQTHTLTKFPRSDDSEDEDRTDVCSACYYFVFSLVVNEWPASVKFSVVRLSLFDF